MRTASNNGGGAEPAACAAARPCAVLTAGAVPRRLFTVCSPLAPSPLTATMSPTSSRLRADAPSFSPTFASSSPVAIPQASATDDHGLPADPFELSASEVSAGERFRSARAPARGVFREARGRLPALWTASRCLGARRRGRRGACGSAARPRVFARGRRTAPGAAPTADAVSAVRQPVARRAPQSLLSPKSRAPKYIARFSAPLLLLISLGPAVHSAAGACETSEPLGASVPRWLHPRTLPDAAAAVSLPSLQMSVSPAELEELEEVEGWVSLMAELEVRREREVRKGVRATRAVAPSRVPALAPGRAACALLHNRRARRLPCTVPCTYPWCRCAALMPCVHPDASTLAPDP